MSDQPRIDYFDPISLFFLTLIICVFACVVSFLLEKIFPLTPLLEIELEPCIVVSLPTLTITFFLGLVLGVILEKKKGGEPKE